MIEKYIELDRLFVDGNIETVPLRSLKSMVWQWDAPHYRLSFVFPDRTIQFEKRFSEEEQEDWKEEFEDFLENCQALHRFADYEHEEEDN